MPSRIIRESSRWSLSLAALSSHAERAWWRVNTVFDDFGRYYGDVDALYSAAFPVPASEMNRETFSGALTELVKVDCIRFYESAGRRYVYVPSWDKHQKRRAKESRFPAPANICAQMPADVPVVVVGFGDVVGDESGVVRARDAAEGPQDCHHPAPGPEWPEGEASPEAPPLVRPSTAFACPDCTALLRVVADAGVVFGSLGPKEQAWVHEAHSVRGLAVALRVARQRVSECLGSGKRRFLAPRHLFEPGSWAIAMNSLDDQPPRRSLKQLLGEA